MTQRDKKLLLKDLCARLPYGVKVKVVLLHSEEYKYTYVNAKLIYIDLDYTGVLSDNGFILQQDISELKPYLFPLSNMTEEQYKSLEESGILSNCSHSYEYVNPHIHGVSFIFKGFKTYSLELIEWLNKNHFDYRGLIEKGLAINATGLNIY